MDKEKPGIPKDFYVQVQEVLGEQFWQEIGEMIPVTGPRVDMYHTQYAVVVLAELPELRSPEQVGIRLEGQTLTLEGEIPCPYPVTDNRMIMKERFFGVFRRTLTLPKPVLSQEIKAAYRQGLLIVELPIDSPTVPTNIPVNFGT